MLFPFALLHFISKVYTADWIWYYFLESQCNFVRRPLICAECFMNVIDAEIRWPADRLRSRTAVIELDTALTIFCQSNLNLPLPVCWPYSLGLPVSTQTQTITSARLLRCARRHDVECVFVLSTRTSGMNANGIQISNC